MTIFLSSKQLANQELYGYVAIFPSPSTPCRNAVITSLSELILISHYSMVPKSSNATKVRNMTVWLNVNKSLTRCCWDSVSHDRC